MAMVAFVEAGPVQEGGSYIKSVVLTAGDSEAAGVEIEENGTIFLTLRAVANDSSSWITGTGSGHFCKELGITTLIGTDAVVTIEWS